MKIKQFLRSGRFSSVVLIDVIFLAISGITVLFMTWYNIGIEADGYKYINYGKQLFEQGFYYFLSHDLEQFPVLYSIFFGLIYQLVGDIYLTAKILNILGLYLLIRYTFLLLKLKGLPQTVIFGVIIGLITSFPMLKTVSIVHTEPIFLGFFGLILYNVAKFDKHETLYNLWVAAFFLGVVTLIRYAGVFFIISFCVFLITNIYTRKISLSNGIKAILLSIALPFLYYVKNTFMVYNSNSFSFTIHETGLSRLLWLFDTILNWFSPWYYLSICVFLLLVYVILDKNVIGQWKFSLISIASYIIGLFAVITFLNNEVPFNDRILLPVYFLIFVISIWAVAKKFGNSYSYLLILLFLSYSITNYNQILNIHQNSLLWSQRSITESNVFEHHKLINAEVVLSNFPYLLKTRTGIDARDTFYEKDFKNKPIKLDYSKDIAIVYFHALPYRSYFMRPDEVVSKHQLSSVFRDEAATLITNY